MISTLNPVIHALRHVNDELTRAGEVIIRSDRVPRPRRPGRPGQVTASANRDTRRTARPGRLIRQLRA